MRQYEVAFIVHPEVDEDGVSALTEKVQGWITASGGTVEKVERLGKKRLGLEELAHEERWGAHQPAPRD